MQSDSFVAVAVVFYSVKSNVIVDVGTLVFGHLGLPDTPHAPLLTGGVLAVI